MAAIIFLSICFKTLVAMDAMYCWTASLTSADFTVNALVCFHSLLLLVLEYRNFRDWKEIKFS